MSLQPGSALRVFAMPWGKLLAHQRPPRIGAGMRIGLYGGSFDPAHDGHRKVSMLAMKRLQLDQVWWLVSPGNPLKDHAGLPPSSARVEQARKVAGCRRIVVSAFEEALGTVYTADTIAFLTTRFPGVRFVWVMGADNLATFHRWRGWHDIATMVPIAVIDRPGWTLKALSSRAAIALAAFRKPEREAPGLADSAPPAWTFLHGPRTPLSSTQLRRNKNR